jgi:uncharacterized membrane protein
VPVVQESVVISSPPEVVFDYLVRPENMSKWDSSIVSAEQVGSEPLQVGTRWRGTSSIVGRRVDWTSEVVDFQPGQRIVSRAVEGKLQFTASYVLEPAAEDRTRLTLRLEAASGLGGTFGRFADPLVQKAQTRSVRSSLQKLAGVLAAPSGVTEAGSR